MTKKQRQRCKEKRRLATEQAQVNQQLEALRNERRRARVRPARFWAPPNRSWIMVRTTRGRGLHAAGELRRQGVPIFEAKVATRYITSRGQQREVEIALMKRTLFVGIATISDLIRVEQCIWVERVLSPNEEGVGWIDRATFRPAWIESETFAGRRVPTIPRGDMQRFADHVTGHLKQDEESPGEDVPSFEIGVSVRVTEGPFASYCGTIEEFDPRTDTYKVAVNIFGKSSPVDCLEDMLEAA